MRVMACSHVVSAIAPVSSCCSTSVRMHSPIINIMNSLKRWMANSTLIGTRVRAFGIAFGCFTFLPREAGAEAAEARGLASRYASSFLSQTARQTRHICRRSVQ